MFSHWYLYLVMSIHHMGIEEIGDKENRGHQNGASRNKNAVIGALGMVGKSASNYVLQIPGAPSLTEIQEITLMGTPHILWKVLSM